MPEKSDKIDDCFPTTLWTELVDCQDDDQELFANLIHPYRAPLICAARALGLDLWSAEDAVSQLMTNVFGKKKILKSILEEYEKSQKRKLRHFLRHCLKNFIFSDFDKENAAKRGNGQKPLELKEDLVSMIINDPSIPPESWYDVCFALSWWEQVKRCFVEELDGRISNRKAILAFLVRDGDLNKKTQEEFAKELGMKIGRLERQLKLAKERMKSLALEETARQTEDPDQVREEMRTLWDILNKYWGREL